MSQLTVHKPRIVAKPRRLFRRLWSRSSESSGQRVDQDPFLETAEAREAREMRSAHNDQVAVACLPPEILEHIFVRCIPANPSRLHYNLMWLNVTKVISRWRRVALACPDLWTTVVFSRPRWTPVMIERSQTVPLVIRVLLRLDSPDLVAPVLLENASRLGTLDVRSPQDLLRTFLSHLEPADAAPNLRDLKIVNTDLDNLGEGGMWLPRDLFHRASVLQSRNARVQSELRLHLESCAFPWDSRWYHHLTHLHLEHINPIQRPTMEMFLTILTASPLLQSLSIIHSSPRTRGEAGQGFPVYLPHLFELTIHCYSSRICARLLEYFHIPPAATIDVVCEVNDGLPHLSLFPRFVAANLGKFDTIDLTYWEGMKLSFLDSRRPCWFHTLRVESTSWSASSTISPLQQILDLVDFSAATSWHLRAVDEMVPKPAPFPGHDSTFLHAWRRTGRRLYSVNTLHLHFCFPTLWLEFLLAQAMLIMGVNYKLPVDKFRDDDGTIDYAYPGLRCLVLHRVDLGESTDQLEPSPSNMLRALLWARRAGRVPIWRLELNDCTNVFSEDLAYFRFFADVVWDGNGESTTQKEDGKDTLRSYSINVFVNMIESGRLSY